jgi:hypothetical protein
MKTLFRISTLVGVAALLMTAGSAQAIEHCNRRGGYHLIGGNWPMHISIKAGSTCQATFGSVGRTVIEFKRLSLVAAPGRGQIKLREGGYYIYTAPSGAGSDSFTLRVCGKQDGKEGCADLQYSVTVN